MNHAFRSKLFLTLAAIFFCSTFIFAQDCSVEKESLKGTYTGDCRNGKAHGKGKAVGTDTYEGDFRSGLPDGQGTYTWSNGNTYTGKFSKGFKDGKGVMTYKRANGSDSIVDGYWKKDEYAGKNEKPYKVYFTSKSIAETEVQYKKDQLNQVSFQIINTSGGALGFNSQAPRLRVDDIQMVKGTHGRTFTTSDAKRSETVISEVTFPARMRISFGSEQLEVEFFEAGSYIVSVRVNQ